MRTVALSAFAFVALACMSCGKGSSTPDPRGIEPEVGTPVAAVAVDAAAPAGPQVDPDGATYVIVHADGLEGAARAWADYRASTGHRVKVISFTAAAGPTRSIDRVRAAALEAFGAHRPDGADYLQGRSLLLLGDAPSVGEADGPTLLPTQTATDLVGALGEPAVGDNLYASAPPRLAPRFAVGRIPARTEAEALVVLDKVKRYEASADGDWQYALQYVAGEGHFGEDIDDVVEQMFVHEVEQTIPSLFTTKMTYASARSSYAFPPLDLPAHIQDLFSTGPLLMTYIGHGHASSFDRMYIPSAGGLEYAMDVFGLEHARALQQAREHTPIMLIMACSTGEFDWAEGRSLGEEMLFAPGGPVAVVAGSRTTHPYANALYVKVFNESVATTAITLGDAFDASKRHLLRTDDPSRSTLDALTKMMLEGADLQAISAAHVVLYNVLGDPGLVLRRPQQFSAGAISVPTSAPAGAPLVVSIPDITGVEGAAPVSVTYTWTALPTAVPVRTRPADYDALLLGNPQQQATERAKILDTHRSANDRVVHGPVEAPASAWPIELRIEVPAAMVAGTSYDLRIEVGYTAPGGPAERQIVGGWRVGITAP